MFYGVSRPPFKDNHFVFLFFLSTYYDRRKQIEGLNLDIRTTFTFLVSLTENPLFCGPHSAMTTILKLNQSSSLGHGHSFDWKVSPGTL